MQIGTLADQQTSFWRRCQGISFHLDYINNLETFIIYSLIVYCEYFQFKFNLLTWLTAL